MSDHRAYVKISTSLPDHPKLARIDSPMASWLYVVGICYAGEHLTDGCLIPRVVERLAGVPARWSRALTESGLWHAGGHSCDSCAQPPAGQVVIHDYLSHQSSRRDIETTRAERSAAGSKGAAKRWQRPSQEPWQQPSQEPWQTDGKLYGKNMAEVEVEVEVEKRPPKTGEVSSEIAPRSRPAPAASPRTELAIADRADVERICTHLADAIAANGSRRPTVGKVWRDAARRMLDRDGRTEQQAHAAIDWCQADEFWRTNILSMPKLREKYDRLRLEAQRTGGRTGNGRISPGDRALMLAQPESEAQ